MLKRLLGIGELQDELRELREELAQIQEAQQALENWVAELDGGLENTADAERVDRDVATLRNRIDALENMLSATEQDASGEQSFSPGERQVLRIFLETDQFLTVSQIGDQLDKSPGTVRKYLSRLQGKVEIEQRQDGRAKTYRLDRDAEKEFLGESPKRTP